MDFTVQSLVLFIIGVNSLICSVSSQKFENLRRCSYLADGNRQATFICDDIDEPSVFHLDNYTCQLELANYGMSRILSYSEGFRYSWPLIVDFENCNFSHGFDREFMKELPNVKTLNISNVELETLTNDLLQTFGNHTMNLIASHNHINQLLELPDGFTYIFANPSNLRTIDLSHNRIDYIDGFIFSGTPDLIALNLSYNHIHLWNHRILSLTAQLLVLDLSNNNLGKLDGRMFVENVNLQHLNLSFNSIERLETDTFANLRKLQHLNLRRSNISTIQMGTFDNLKMLISIDLSKNKLKELMFNQRSPYYYYLLTLHLKSNQLVDLEGITSDRFPRITSLDIQNNKFNCTYLQTFLDSINWNHYLKLDKSLLDPVKPQIQGINCENIALKNETSENTNNETPDVRNVINCDLFVKLMLTSIFIILLALLIVYIIRLLNDNKLSSEIRRPQSSLIHQQKLRMSNIQTEVQK